MPRGKGDNSWVHDSPHFEVQAAPGQTVVPTELTKRFYKCLFVHSDGSECGEVYSGRYSTSLALHLKKHNIDKDTPLPDGQAGRLVQQSLAACVQRSMPTLELNEKVLMMVARLGIACKILMDEDFRDVTGTSMNRNDFITDLCAVIDKLEPHALRKFVKATLALDIGTHKRRYLAFTIVRKGHALYYKMVDAELATDSHSQKRSSVFSPALTRRESEFAMTKPSADI